MCRTSSNPQVIVESANAMSSPSSSSSSHTPTTSSNKKKRVRFSCSLEYVPSTRSKLTTEDILTIWWQQNELDDFLWKATKNARDTRKHKLLMDGLDQALQFARQQPCSFKSISNEEQTEKFLQQVQEDRGLTLWCRYGHSRRGLERLASRLHYESRAYAVEKYRTEILKIHHQQQQQQQQNPQQPQCLPEDSEHSSLSSSSSSSSGAAATLTPSEFLALVSWKSTFSAKVFARMMGHVDAIAAKTTYDPTQNIISNDLMVISSSSSSNPDLTVATEAIVNEISTNTTNNNNKSKKLSPPSPITVATSLLYYSSLQQQRSAALPPRPQQQQQQQRHFCQYRTEAPPPTITIRGLVKRKSVRRWSN